MQRHDLSASAGTCGALVLRYSTRLPARTGRSLPRSALHSSHDPVGDAPITGVAECSSDRPATNGIGLASACGPLGFARRREETSLWRRAGAPPSGTRDPLWCHHGPSRWSADESSSAPHERISGRASRPSSRVSSKVPWRASRNRDSPTPRGLLLAWDRVAPRRLWRRRHTPAASGRQPWPGLVRGVAASEADLLLVEQAKV